MIILGLAACTPLVRAEQPIHPGSISLQPGKIIGQTFVSRYDGLQGISIYLKPESTGKPGSINLSLYSNPESDNPIASVGTSLDQVVNDGFNTFYFDAIRFSTRKSFFLTLSYDGTDKLSIGRASGESYLNGALYLNGQSQDAQLAFKLIYDPVLALIGILSEFGSWAILLVAGAIGFVLPGWGLLLLVYPAWQSRDWLEKLALSAGISLAIYPLFFLWTDVIGIHLGFLYAWLPPAAGLVFILYRMKFWNLAQDHKKINFWDILPKKFHWNWNILIDITLVILISFIIFTRLWSIRMLPAPMWGDSYHHTLITQLLIDNQGLFRTWEPYADLQSFTYHFGFHSFAAVYHWLTGLKTPQAVLWAGQIINILAVIMLYALTKRITENRWGGVLTILISGLLLSMPMYYLNWGRYTQLAGQVILTTGVIFVWDNLRASKISWGLLSLAFISLAGLFLTHYRVLLFLLPFYLISALFQFRTLNLKNYVLSIISQGSAALILVLPWLLRIYQGRLPFQLTQQISTPATQIPSATLEYNVIGDLRQYLPEMVWWLFAAAVVFAILRKNKTASMVAFWWVGVFFMANPAWFGLPGTGILSNFAVLIAAYIPSSILVGAAAGGLLDLRKPAVNLGNGKFISPAWMIQKPAMMLILSLIFIIGGLFGARYRLRDIKPAQYSLVTYPDVSAAEWIKNNLPPETKFLVNSFFAYSGTLIVGSDAGWWLPLLSERQTMLPPMPYVSEKGSSPDNVQETNQLAELIYNKGLEDPEVKEELAKRQITHIFIGQQQGMVNAPQPPYLVPDKLLRDPALSLIYHQDRVWIFRINQ